MQFLSVWKAIYRFAGGCGCGCLTCVASFPLFLGGAGSAPVQAFTPFTMRRGCFGGPLVLFVLPTSCIRNAPGDPDPGSSDCLTNSRAAITRLSGWWCVCLCVCVSPVQRENYVVCDLPWTLNVSRLPPNRFSPAFPRFAIEISLWERERGSARGVADISEQKTRNKKEKFACNSLRLALVC